MSRLRAWFTRVVLALGAATFFWLLWKFDPVQVWGRLLSFGWGFAVVLPFQAFDHALNAAGWRFSFAPEAAAKTSLAELMRVRVAGDGVNYLTPSANVAGEFVRPAMLRAPISLDEKVASVVLAKIAQAAGQALFILAGLAYLLQTRLFAFQGRQALIGGLAVGAILAGLAASTWILATSPPEAVARRFPRAMERTAPVRALLRAYLSRRPGRFAASIAMFAAGYAWGALEIWLIVQLLGAPLGPAACLSIEFLSNLVDAMAFMVPAKIGTQEAGKAAIFAGMGLPADLGFTVGVVRHVREVAWAGLGFALYASDRPARA